MLEGENIICFSSVDWGHVPTSKKHIMTILARRNRVLYVETMSSRMPSLKRIHLKRAAERIINWIRGIKEVSKSPSGELFVYSPIIFFPYWRPMKKVNQLIFTSVFRRLVRTLRLENPILWFYIPLPINFFGRLGEKAIIYHCVDEWSTYPGGKNEALQVLEEELLRKADSVFCASKPLLERKRMFNVHTYYLPHGADFQPFRKLPEDVPLPPDIASIKRPILGMVGGIASWIDWELLKYTAEIHPEWSIVLIGPISYNADLTKADKVSNIHILGLRSYESLPNYYRAIDVCIIAFILNEHIRYCQPTRIYEHLAAGKPVVSTDFPAVREVAPEMAKVAQNRGGFVELISRALKEDDRTSVMKRKEIARQNNWRQRVETMSNLIKQTISV